MPGRSTVTWAKPIAVSALQRLASPLSSALKSAPSHLGVLATFPISPGGSVKWRFFVSAGLPYRKTFVLPPAAASSNSVLVVSKTVESWKGCEPACVSSVPSSFSGRSLYASTPYGAGVSLTSVSRLFSSDAGTFSAPVLPPVTLTVLVSLVPTGALTLTRIRSLMLSPGRRMYSLLTSFLPLPSFVFTSGQLVVCATLVHVSWIFGCPSFGRDWPARPCGDGSSGFAPSSSMPSGRVSLIVIAVAALIGS